MRRVLGQSVSFAALALALVAPAQASAEPPPPSPASSPDIAGAEAANAVEQVVVIANRTAEHPEKVGQSFTVLTLQQIRADQEPVISDILARTPGIVMTRNGGVGETTALNIRGADTDQTMVLIDGVKLDDPSAPGGGFDFSDLLVGDVSRVEVLRGPQSTLYGSQAIGGVVSIVTADPTRPFQGDAQVEGGSYGTYYLKGGVGGHDGPVTWRLAGDDYSTTGVSAFDAKLGGREPDGYRNQGVSGRLSYDFTPDISLDLRGLFVNARSKFDGFSTSTGALGDDGEYGATQEGIAYAGLNFNLFDARLKNRLALQYTSTDRNDYDPADAPVTKTFDGVGTNFRAEYQGDYAIAPGWQAVFGAEHDRSTIDASSPAFNDPASPAFFPPGSPPINASATIDSGYGQIQAEALPGLNLTGGVRYDDHSAFGGHTTGQAAAAWSLNGGDTVLRASWGQGFKAPSLYELYSQYGNAGLRPEQADGWDAGVEQRFWDRRIDLQATYFSRDTSNLIVFIDCLSTATPQCANGRLGFYDNVERARADGVELSVTVRPLEALSITGNYTLTDDTDRSPGSATFGKSLPRIPRDAVNGEISYVWPIKLTTAVALRYASRSFDDAANTILLKAYTLVDLRASYPLTPSLEVYGRIENLANTHYETDFQYGTLGRAAYLGLRATF
jgi:vitamin B12 transporter